MKQELSEKKQKPYICELHWDHEGPEHIKKLYLAGEDSQESENLYYKALKEIDVLGDAVISWEEFLNGSIKIFSKHGFFRVDY